MSCVVGVYDLGIYNFETYRHWRVCLITKGLIEKCPPTFFFLKSEVCVPYIHNNIILSCNDENNIILSCVWIGAVRRRCPVTKSCLIRLNCSSSSDLLYSCFPSWTENWKITTFDHVCTRIIFLCFCVPGGWVTVGKVPYNSHLDGQTLIL